MLGGIVAGGAARWFSGNRKDGAADRQAGPEPSGHCTSQSATLTVCSVVNALVGGDRENDVVILEAQRLGKVDESLLQFSGQPLGSSVQGDFEVLFVFRGLLEIYHGELVVVGVGHLHVVALYLRVAVNIPQGVLARPEAWNECSDPVATALVPDEDGGDVVAIAFLQLIDGAVHRKAALSFFLDHIACQADNVPPALELQERRDGARGGLTGRSSCCSSWYLQAPQLEGRRAPGSVCLEILAGVSLFQG